MQIDAFIAEARARLGAVSGEAENGFRTILGEAAQRGTQVNRLAYILATVWWETARTMQPVREAFFVAPNDFAKAEAWRKKNLHYYPYYGRGYVQLTWKANYRHAGEKLGVDFVADPDQVMTAAHALDILFDGMDEGWFTGKALDDYIDEIDEPDSADLAEYVRARRIINGTDKAQTIGGMALAFEAALKAAGYSAAGVTAVAAGGLDAHIAALGLKHFKAYEFRVKGASHGNPKSAAYGLNTDPPAALYGHIDKTARVLDELRERLGRPITLSSVYRSKAYNKAIGGAADSSHLRFNAVDFAVVGSPFGPAHWAAALREMRSAGLFSGGIGTYSTFVHVDTRGSDADWNG
ncbi:D-Ala-D-Ala carboxypeptidase family metallohydrolase [Methylopila turkensis]|uniref:Peptidase M15A C-terminal domain-containing protein n=1 Tax=Methylopila turkensis TaxID=1437816 RepID=A0A9W6JNH0_9HYPH|nr:D-Ala-D-Ala carboxypeptidase family metallohydrolase [Methylopila turkensis]GLK80866.1 hypothetical protein GCM10008174_26070 [Methylopila turkensis]